LRRFGFFGPGDKHDVPPGGFCISVFALVRRGSTIPMLRPRPHPRWGEEWAPNWRIYEPAMLERETAGWRLPSTYVKEGEAPREALDRVVVDQVGIKKYVVRGDTLENFYDESRRYPGKMHRDYCFVFKVSTEEEGTVMPWISEIGHSDPAGVRGRAGSAQEYLLSRLGLV